MEEWKEYKATDFCKNVTDGTHDSPKQKSEGYYLITSKHIKGNTIDFDSAYKISEEDYNKIIQRSKVDQWDVIISMIGAYCGFCYLEKSTKTDYAIKNVGLFKVGSEIKSKWLYYYLSSPAGQNKLHLLRTGSSQPYIALNSLRNFTIPVPDEKTMRSIIYVLQSLDDKIEVNRRINENLEQQAQALFKSWFVDFEPFKNQPFVESELGMIPQGWRVGTLGDICVTNKRTYKGDFVSEIEYIDTGCVTNNIIDTPQILNPAIDKIPSRARRAVTEGDIIYSSVRPNQRHYALLFNPSSNTVVSTGFVVITANWSGYRYYIYQYLIQDEIVNKLQAIAEQSVSTFPSLNASDLTNLKIVIPPNDVVGDFAALNCSFITQINKKQQESRCLAELRDTLLPRLMSGELHVNDMLLSEKR